MKTSELFLSLLIILIFVGILLFNVFVVNINNIKDNWPEYRCNPMVMPFSQSLGDTNPSDNFTYCIQNMQNNYMGFLLQPVNHSLSLLGNGMSEFQNSLNNVRKMFSQLRDFITNVVQSIFGVFLNILIEFQKITISIIDMIGKLSGILTTLLYMLDGTIKTMESAWNGPPGQTLRFVGGMCFHPNSTIELQDGTLTTIKDIKLGTILKENSYVKGTLCLDNTFKKETIYTFTIDEESNDHVYVTGSHMVQHNNKFIFVKDHPDAKKTNIECDVLYSVITHDHKIKVGNYVFWDYDDLPEMRMT